MIGRAQLYGPGRSIGLTEFLEWLLPARSADVGNLVSGRGAPLLELAVAYFVILHGDLEVADPKLSGLLLVDVRLHGLHDVNRPVVEVGTVDETTDAVHAYQRAGSVWNSLVLRRTLPLRGVQCAAAIDVLLHLLPRRTPYLVRRSARMLVAKLQAAVWHAHTRYALDAVGGCCLAHCHKP